MDDSSTKKETWEISNRIQALDVIAAKHEKEALDARTVVAEAARAKVKAMEQDLKSACAKATEELETLCNDAERIVRLGGGP